MTKEERTALAPVWEKVLLTLEEASAYTGIGINKMREMADSPGCDFVLWKGRQRMIKRKKLEEYLENSWSI